MEAAERRRAVAVEDERQLRRVGEIAEIAIGIVLALRRKVARQAHEGMAATRRLGMGEQCPAILERWLVDVGADQHPAAGLIADDVDEALLLGQGRVGARAHRREEAVLDAVAHVVADAVLVERLEVRRERRLQRILDAAITLVRPLLVRAQHHDRSLLVGGLPSLGQGLQTDKPLRCFGSAARPC